VGQVEIAEGGFKGVAVELKTPLLSGRLKWAQKPPIAAYVQGAVL